MKFRVSDAPELKILNAQIEREIREIYQLNDKLKELEKKEFEFIKIRFIQKDHRDKLDAKRRE